MTRIILHGCNGVMGQMIAGDVLCTLAGIGGECA